MKKYILIFLALAGVHYILTFFVAFLTMWKPGFLTTMLSFPVVLLYKSIFLEESSVVTDSFWGDPFTYVMILNSLLWGGALTFIIRIVSRWRSHQAS